MVTRVAALWALTLALAVMLGSSCFAVARQTPQLSPAVLLARAQESYDKAVSVKSQSGDYAEHEWTAFPGEKPTEHLAKVHVVMSGDKFKILARYFPAKGKKFDRSVVQLEEIVCDGTRWTLSGDGGEPQIHTLASEHDARNNLAFHQQNYTVLSAYLNPRQVLYYYKLGEIHIVGNERVDGVDCVVMEGVHVYHQKGAKRHMDTRRLWIAPSMGYTIQRLQCWAKGGPMEPLPVKSLYGQANVRYRKYNNGQWGPSAAIEEQYTVDAKTGRRSRELRRIREFSSDYSFDVPVDIPAVEDTSATPTK